MMSLQESILIHVHSITVNKSTSTAADSVAKISNLIGCSDFIFKKVDSSNKLSDHAAYQLDQVRGPNLSGMS